MTKPNRRQFIRDSAAAQARVPGANNRIRFGLIGCGGQGTGELRAGWLFASVVAFERNAAAAHSARRVPDDRRFDCRGGSGQADGNVCVAVTTSFATEALQQANLVVDSFTDREFERFLSPFDSLAKRA